MLNRQFANYERDFAHFAKSQYIFNFLLCKYFITLIPGRNTHQNSCKRVKHPPELLPQKKNWFLLVYLGSSELQRKMFDMKIT